MVDLSKLPWGELKRVGIDVRPEWQSWSLAIEGSIVAWLGDTGWTIRATHVDEVPRVLESIKLVDAFILEHSKPKLPDVVPPEGCIWWFGKTTE